MSDRIGSVTMRRIGSPGARPLLMKEGGENGCLVA